MIVLLILGILFLLLAGFRVYSFIQYNKRRARNNKPVRRKRLDVLTVGIFAVSILLVLLYIILSASAAKKAEEEKKKQEETPPPVYVPVEFTADNTVASDPAKWAIQWEILENGNVLPNYTRNDDITFSKPEDYFALPGIATFRGNNYRDSASYGNVTVTEKSFTEIWDTDTTALPGGVWEGSGWTGQPLIVKWDDETKSVMNLYADKKSKTDLVEIIYATLDGHIYFLDLDDGSYTRDPINIGMCFKGAGSLDPRGYPIMYVGSGDVNIEGKRPRMFVISLIDGSVLYEYGHEEGSALRTDNNKWCAFDSAPLVDAETDTLIWPGENGVLYTIKLNTNYNKASGTLSVSPSAPVITRYKTSKSGDEKYWLGYEASVNIVENYLYVSENGGMFYCVDLDTMELVWAQDTKDDSNSTPVFERTGEDEGYIYTAPSLHWTKDNENKGTISIYKLNAVTGEIVWEKPYEVYTVENVSGGVQASPVLGKSGTNMDGLVIFSVSRTPNEESGILVALDTQTGEEVWKIPMNYYAWSSPVAVYDGNTGYVIIGDSGGNMMCIDGKTGDVLDTINLGGLIEASPAVYEDTLIIGTRSKKIFGIKIS